MKHERWHKKNVVLTLRGRQTTFSVAQELFSSHEVDAGSRALLRSLDFDSLPTSGTAIDFGCGYGVLGLALRDALPGWQVQLVDRDALAVSFAEWNAVNLGLEASTTCTVGLGVDSAPAAGADLMLWNVPGKVGEPVQRALARDVVATTAQGGLVAVVVVHPIADLVREALLEGEHAEIVHEEATADHTVVHARKREEAVVPGDPFERGVFDREPAGFGVDDLEYDLVPVTGLPEYDSYSYASQLVFDLFRSLNGQPTSFLILNPGQGHVSIVASHLFRPERLTLVDRDLLALRASGRALVETGLAAPAVDLVADADLHAAAPTGQHSHAVLMLESQVRNEVHQARLHDLGEYMEPGGSVIVAGPSSVVSRYLSFAAKDKRWKARDRVKRSGYSAARLEKAT